MIELRWLEYESYTNPESGEYFSTPSSYRKLQFRTQVMQMGYGYTSGGAGGMPQQYERPMGMIWTEWQDVPVEYAPVIERGADGI